MTSRGEQGCEVLERLCRVACELGPYDGAAILSWEDGEPLCLAARGAPLEVGRVRRSLQREQRTRQRLEGGEVIRTGACSLLPLGTKATFAVWHPPGQEPSPAALDRLTSLAWSNFQGWRQQGPERALRHQLLEARWELARRGERMERAMRRAAHDLKAPLSAMKGYVDMMLRGMAGPLTPTMQRYLARLHQAIERERELIDSALHVPAPGEEEPDLKRILLASLERSRDALRTGRLSLALDCPTGPCRVPGSPAHLELLCRRLVRQVIRSAAGDGALEVTLRPTGSRWTLSLRVKSASVDMRGWSICDAIARRLGGAVDLSWRDGMALEAVLPRNPLQGAPARPAPGPAPAQTVP